MAMLSFFAAQLTIATALILGAKQSPPSGMVLRGSEVASAPSPALAASPAAGSPAFVDERGERGHFYYANGCEDCFYKGAQCGCGPAMEYFACVTKHCHSANNSLFAEKCSNLGNTCSSTLNIDCNGQETVCTSKHNQLSTGGMGLSFSLEGVGNDAFCGPYGKCIGSMHMKVNIHGLQQRLAQVITPVGAPSPAPAIAASPLPAPAPAPASVWLECGLPVEPNADIDDRSKWSICRAQVAGDKAGCDLPMNTTLEGSKEEKAYCVLTEGNDGNPPKRLTELAWFSVSNVHGKPTFSPFSTLFVRPAWMIWLGKQLESIR